MLMQTVLPFPRAASTLTNVVTARFGGVFEDLLDVDVHLPQEGGGDGKGVKP